MGLFDYIHYNGKCLQTKDTDEQYLHSYYIESGRLLKSVGHTEDRSERAKWEKENPGKSVPERLTGLLALGGMLTWVETGREDQNYHGYLHAENYRFKFTDGDLVEVIDTEATQSDSENVEVLSHLPEGENSTVG